MLKVNSILSIIFVPAPALRDSAHRRVIFGKIFMFHIIFFTQWLNCYMVEVP